MNTAIDEQNLIAKINSMKTIAAAMWMTVIGTVGILFLPLMVGGIIDELGFDKIQAGYIAAAEMAGVAIASGLGIYWVRRVNWQTTATYASIIFIGANWVSTGIDGYWLMFIARLLVGLSSGVLLAIGLACQSDSKNAQRIFGYWVACQMTVSSVGYLLLPGIRTQWGLDGFLFALMILGATSFVSILFLPKHGKNRTVDANGPRSSMVLGGLALSGALLFFMAQGGLWAFLERLGLAANLTVTQIGFALAISSYCGIVGGLAKNWLADFMGATAPFVCVAIGEIVMLFLFANDPGNVLYAVAVCMLQFFWAMGMATLMGGFNLIDKSGGLVLLLMSTAKAGYSLGPALMGWLIDGDDYSWVLISSGAFVIVGMLTVAVLIRTFSR